jgi:hypothetical protein
MDRALEASLATALSRPDVGFPRRHQPKPPGDGRRRRGRAVGLTPRATGIGKTPPPSRGNHGFTADLRGLWLWPSEP